MSLKDSIQSASQSAIKRELVTLPVAGASVQVRSLMSGPVQRMANAAKEKQNTIAIALATEDPSTGKLIWNVNSQEDRDAIEGLHVNDSLAILAVVNRLSYIGEEAEALGKENSSTEEKSSTIS